ncbi:MAG: hypothetical protein RMK32_09640 [Anaerolineae bacterium]|nr:hypothetical protein [Thermoflexus sp.]MDW8065873.1 hypothetical protein [Anaerolineae bacterium]
MAGNKVAEFYLFVLGILCLLLCLIFAARQANPFRPPITYRERIRRAVAVGLLTGVGFLSLFLIIDVVYDSGFQWTIGSIVVSWLCIVLPLQILAAVGTYIEFVWQDKIRRYLANLAGKNHKEK